MECARDPVLDAALEKGLKFAIIRGEGRGCMKRDKSSSDLNINQRHRRITGNKAGKKKKKKKRKDDDDDEIVRWR